jgi:signal transduction histidine kinase
MNPQPPFERYQELQAYVGWTEADAELVRAVGPRVEPYLKAIIDDFYDEIARHPRAKRVITGGQAQIERLKGTLNIWIRELFSGCYDEAYVARRWRVGWRHVEIGLEQLYTNVALSRIRTGLMKALHETWEQDGETLRAAVRALNKLLDLDLAIIEDAYQAEHLARQQRIERLATIGQVACGVAHELRNPLNVVRTSVYYLLNARHPTPEKAAEHMRRIERHVELADGVITALSSFAKMPNPQSEPFSSASCFQQALETNPLPASVELKVDFSPELPQVAGDCNQLQIVLGNLIRNARDAMPRGGQLTVTGRPVGHGDRVEIDISDTGTGIAREDLARIMEPLYSTKARGLGLGLAIARSILDKNRGSLRVISELGRGSTFTVTLPAASAIGDVDEDPLP